MLLFGGFLGVAGVWDWRMRKQVVVGQGGSGGGVGGEVGARLEDAVCVQCVGYGEECVSRGGVCYGCGWVFVDEGMAAVCL